MQRAAARTRSTIVTTVSGLVLLSGLALTGCTAGAEAEAPASGPASASGAVATPAATPVPPPTPGTTGSAVPSEQVRTRKPVALEARAEAADGVRVRLSEVEAIEAEARGPGEVAGPAVAVTVEIENSTSQPVSLASTVVNLTASDTSPGSLMSAEPAKPLPAAVGPSASVTGVYVFTVPKSKRNPVTVEVAVTPADPVAVFRGRAAS